MHMPRDAKSIHTCMSGCIALKRKILEHVCILKMMRAVQNLGNNDSTVPKFGAVHEIIMLWQCKYCKLVHKVST